MFIDSTMCLANRTAVYDIAAEISALAPHALHRYWRFLCSRPLNFRESPLSSAIGKAASRIVFADIESEWGKIWPRPDMPGLFIDPIFTLKTPLRRDDIVICHDIAPVTNPEFYDPGTGVVYDRGYKRIQQAGCGIVFVSKFTRQQFLNRYPGEYSFNKVIDLFFRGKGPPSGEATSLRAKKYILMVGGMERRKNFDAAITAFELSELGSRGVELVISGPRGNASSDLHSRIANHKYIHHIGFIPVSQLMSLYANAEALFFPSLVEGFGVPALEAPSLGVLPIVSAGTVLEEVVGPAGLTVNPHSINDMARGLVEVMDMTAVERRERVSQIVEHQRRFNVDNFRDAWREVIATRLS